DLQEATRRAASAEVPTPVLKPVLKRKAPEALSLEKALEDYEAWYERNNRTAWRALPSVRWFVESVGEEVDTRAVTRDHLQRFVTGRVDGRSAITVRDDYARVRAFLRWIAGRKDGAIVGTPWTGIERPKAKSVTREAPSAEKVKAVLAKLRSHPWLGDYCTVLAETGMRPSELLGLRGIDVRDKLCSITPWEGRDLKSEWSKRVIELNETARGILKSRKETMFDKTLPIFANGTGGVYAEHSVLHYFQDWLGGGKLRKPPESLRMTLYDFRHFFCSEHAAPGPQHMEIEALAAYIGHSPASTQTLLRWYADQRALRRGAPAPLVGEPKEGAIVLMKRPTVEGG
ncbi:MAG TPA: hypothetical protein VEJ18_10240, partial [Planctomycetota bacterium]|nr:hypothetical protein [Planctomycetota bacterium]